MTAFVVVDGEAVNGLLHHEIKLPEVYICLTFLSRRCKKRHLVYCLVAKWMLLLLLYRLRPPETNFGPVQAGVKDEDGMTLMHKNARRIMVWNKGEGLNSLLACYLMNFALTLWKTDLNFREWPYGPPDRGIRHGIADKLYRLGLWLTN
jgi:hypothetical protein